MTRGSFKTMEGRRTNEILELLHLDTLDIGAANLSPSYVKVFVDDAPNLKGYLIYNKNNEILVSKDVYLRKIFFL